MGNRPTILQIIPRLDTGGAELSTIEITEALTRAGARALVATEGGRLADRVTAAGGELITFPAETKNPLKLWANARSLAKLVAAEGVTLLHARSRAPAWSALWAARRASIPFVTTYHGAYAEKGPLKRHYNSVMARADRVIANSAYTAALVRSRYGTDTAKIRVIHRGIDPAAFDPASIGDGRRAALRASWRVADAERIVLQAARLTAWKGQRVLIEAAARLHGQGRLDGVVIVLAGDAQGRDGYRDGLVHLAAGLGVAEHVRLPGHVDDIPAAFAISHVGVVASVEPEAFGRATAEAQAAACPVIATDIGAPPEAVLDIGKLGTAAGTGWLVPPGDATALANALAEALSLPDERRRDIGERARAHIAAGFTLEAMKRSTLRVYDELLDAGLEAAFDKARPATNR